MMKGLTQVVRNYISKNPGCTKDDLISDLGVSWNNLKHPISRLTKNGSIDWDNGYYIKILNANMLVDEFNRTSQEFERREYLKNFLSVVIDSIKECSDHTIKIQYIQEGRRLLKELK